MSGVLRKPSALAPGARVAVVAPASPFDPDQFDAGIAELRTLGFDPVWDDRVFARRGFMSGDAALRAQSFDDAWRRPDIAALIGVRGGYGSVQLLPHLDPARIVERPCAFIGYSDLTSILTFLVCQCGIVAFHGPSVAGRLGRGVEAYDRASFLGTLMNVDPLGELAPDGLQSIKAGDARGRLLGGTLTQLAAAAGTPYALAPWDDTILLLEDVAERPYRLDRMLAQLRLSGALAHVRGIVLGTFPKCDEPGGTPSARGTLADALADFPGPIVFGFPTGHVDGPAMTVPLGVQARLVAHDTSRLVIEEAAVQ
jgi:muramoyltetrapeptide carboxypeptidase